MDGDALGRDSQDLAVLRDDRLAVRRTLVFPDLAAEPLELPFFEKTVAFHAARQCATNSRAGSGEDHETTKRSHESRCCPNTKAGGNVSTAGYTAYSTGGTLHTAQGAVEIDEDFPNGTIDGGSASFHYQATADRWVELYLRNIDGTNNMDIEECHFWIQGL